MERMQGDAMHAYWGQNVIDNTLWRAICNMYSVLKIHIPFDPYIPLLLYIDLNCKNVYQGMK